ncbi:MAG: patatin-like phospholipase family protein [Bacillota bacterium]
MKRALVLSGGGNKGAFEVGALYHLIRNYHFNFDLFSGTSVGALNCAFLAQGRDPVEQSKRIAVLKEKWFAISGNRDIYYFNYFNIIRLFFGGSLYQPLGLKKLINSLISPDELAKGKPVLIPTVALEDGQLYIADSRNPGDRADMTCFVLASASLPVYFPPVKIRQKHWVDGGLRDITPLNAVLNEDPQEIVVITTYPVTSGLEPVFPPFKEVTNTFSVIHRVIDILTAEIGSNDLKVIQRIKQNNLNHCRKMPRRLIIISPEQPFTESSLKFSPRLIREYFQLGTKAAENARVFS